MHLTLGLCFRLIWRPLRRTGVGVIATSSFPLWWHLELIEVTVDSGRKFKIYTGRIYGPRDREWFPTLLHDTLNINAFDIACSADSLVVR